MNLDTWFPSTIGRSYHPEWIEPMTYELNKFFENNENELNNAFYYNGLTTYGKYNLHEMEEFNSFKQFVLSKGMEFLELMGFDSTKVPWKPFMFANSFLEGSNHPKHLHSQCTLSGIFYLKTPPGSSNIIFHPNQPFKDFFDYMFFVKDSNNWYAAQNAQYIPQPGLLLIWPAWLYHEVPPNNSKEPRVSIVFNL